MLIIPLWYKLSIKALKTNMMSNDVWCQEFYYEPRERCWWKFDYEIPGIPRIVTLPIKNKIDSRNGLVKSVTELFKDKWKELYELSPKRIHTNVLEYAVIDNSYPNMRFWMAYEDAPSTAGVWWPKSKIKPQPRMFHTVWVREYRNSVVKKVYLYTTHNRYDFPYGYIGASGLVESYNHISWRMVMCRCSRDGTSEVYAFDKPIYNKHGTEYHPMPYKSMQYAHSPLTCVGPVEAIKNNPSNIDSYCELLAGNFH